MRPPSAGYAGPEVPGLSSKGAPWSVEEHRAFLAGLAALGRGNWRAISRQFVRTRTPTQVASHAQKHFLRAAGHTKRRSRFADIEEEVLGDAKGAEPGHGHWRSSGGADTLSSDNEQDYQHMSPLQMLANAAVPAPQLEEEVVRATGPAPAERAASAVSHPLARSSPGHTAPPGAAASSRMQPSRFPAVQPFPVSYSAPQQLTAPAAVGWPSAPTMMVDAAGVAHGIPCIPHPFHLLNPYFMLGLACGQSGCQPLAALQQAAAVAAAVHPSAAAAAAAAATCPPREWSPSSSTSTTQPARSLANTSHVLDATAGGPQHGAEGSGGPGAGEVQGPSESSQGSPAQAAARRGQPLRPQAVVLAAQVGGAAAPPAGVVALLEHLSEAPPTAGVVAATLQAPHLTLMHSHHSAFRPLRG